MKTYWNVTLLTVFAITCVLPLLGQEKPSHTSGARVAIGPNLRVSANTTTGNRNECWMTANPMNRKFLIAVSQSSTESTGTGGVRRCMTAISRNGGETWREVQLPKQEPGAFDPMTAAAADGRIYVMQAIIGQNAAVTDAGGTRREGTIRIWSTIDEGRHWQGPSELKCPVAPDHPRIVVDTSSGPHHGRLYVAWNEVADTVFKRKFHIFLNYSDDGGQTFSEPVLLGGDDDGKLVMTEPLVLSDGTLLLTYYQYFFPLSGSKNDHQPVYILRSTDGGETFGKPEKIGEVGSSGWRYLRRDFGRAFTLPIFTVDTSPTSRFRDHLYMVWDQVTGGRSDIWLITSADNGHTWSKPQQVNDNPPPPQGAPMDFRMTPVVAVNKAGVVGIAWYDRRDDPSRRCWRQYFTASLNGGETFLPNVTVSSAPSCPDKDTEPSVYVTNTARELDDTLPTQEELKGLPDTERRQLEEELGIAAALKEAQATQKVARLRVSFDRARNVWPGHYTGLAVDSDGIFHALWADRRNKLQQLFTTTLEVLTSPEPAAPATHEAVVTDRVQVIGGPGKFDEAKGTGTFELQVRNVSDAPIYAPIRIRITKVESGLNGPSATIVDPDGGGTPGVPAYWDLSKLLGSRNRLDPTMVSEAKMAKVKTKTETGLDAVFEFEVIGQVVATRPATAVGR